MLSSVKEKTEQLLKEYFYFKTTSKEAKQSLLGLVLIKLGTGGVAIWSNMSLYFFSYFTSNGQNPDLTYS